LKNANRIPAEENKRPSREQAMEAVTTFILWAGDDPQRGGMLETPRRVVAALEEVFDNPKQIKDKEFLRKTFGKSPDAKAFEKYINRKVSREKVIDAMETLVRWVGYDGNDIRHVAEEFFQGFSELVVGLQVDISKIYSTTFNVKKNGNNGLILLKNIPLASLCEHHLFGFKGKAHIAYIPGIDEEGIKHVVGISKLARGADARARRFQIQEGLTADIAQDLMRYMNPPPRAVAVVIESSHNCMQLRGAKSIGSIMITSHTEMSKEFSKKYKEKTLDYTEILALQSIKDFVKSAYHIRARL